MTHGLFFAIIVLAPFVVWLLFRSRGYKRLPLDAPPGPGWTATGESFIDPTSGEALDVWMRPQTGERAYVRKRAG
jgi:hypothetical protein